jgi:hypothetical protein
MANRLVVRYVLTEDFETPKDLKDNKPVRWTTSSIAENAGTTEIYGCQKVRSEKDMQAYKLFAIKRDSRIFHTT